MVNFSKYRKGLIGAAGVLVVLGEALTDASISGQEGLSIAVAVLVALGVYQVPNKAAA
jgi:hypothetical protein